MSSYSHCTTEPFTALPSASVVRHLTISGFLLSKLVVIECLTAGLGREMLLSYLRAALELPTTQRQRGVPFLGKAALPGAHPVDYWSMKLMDKFRNERNTCKQKRGRNIGSTVPLKVTK
ncbi:hypothetical protein BSL78_21864 [Apostichopus japonicus]|uniref:Uncharacterized protein n=1 Tax=Stichopus japonicus TaxID=307972 RepID=A0A2G8JZV0_STIJA|nr:hypothetical protein BSL78_21864 [Apostichopus japonicus]